MAVEGLRRSPMMSRMLDALENGEDIGHYGRLVLDIIGRRFIRNDEPIHDEQRRPGVRPARRMPT